MAVSDFLSLGGGAISDLFGSMGSKQEAQGYQQAASIAEENAQLEKESTAIQETQAQRQTYMAVSGGAADIGGAGLAASGSALDVLRSSAQQGALQKGVVGVQGQINEQAYQAQANAYTSEAAAAKTASKGQGIGGILSAVGAVAALF